MHLWNIFFEMLNFILPVDVEMSPNEVMEAQLYYCYQLKNLVWTVVVAVIFFINM